MLVVGLGPVGAALANLLARYGVTVLAVDQATEIFTKPRAIALDNEALRILQMAGVREGEFATIGIPQVQYHSPLFGRFARIGTTKVIDGHPALVTFYQPELETVLRRKLAQAPTACVLPGTTLEAFEDDGTGVTARLKDRDGKCFEARARFLVGADGASSLVRRTLGLDFPGSTFAQDWLIVDAIDVPDPVDHVEFICDPRRPTPRMPAPGGRQRWEFMLRPGETREQMESPDNVQAPAGALVRRVAQSASSAPRFTGSTRARRRRSRRGAASSPGTPRTSRRRSRGRDSSPACATPPTSAGSWHG